MPELEQLHLARQHQHLHEQLLNFLEKPPPKHGQRVMVRVRVGRHKPKRHRVIGRTLDLAAGMHAAGIAVNQQAQQHRRVMRGRAASAVLARQCAQVRLLDDFYQE